MYTFSRFLALIILALMMGTVIPASAQRLEVESFRPLPTDISAFIDPVYDLNGDACAVVKVVAPSDTEFTAPLGIVKRVDRTGEIWLYLPKGSIKITLRHPRLGVLRDYGFSERLESSHAYELRLAQECEAPAVEARVLRDTLVLTHTDTLVITAATAPVAFKVCLLATGAYGPRAGSAMGGIMAAAMRSHGAYIHLGSNLGREYAAAGSCDRYGYIGGRLPYYSGSRHHTAWVACAGGIHRVSGKVGIFEGVGYGRELTLWQLGSSEGGAWVRNRHLSTTGIAVQAGTLLTFGRIALQASITTIRTRVWYGSAGVGIRLGKSYSGSKN